MKPEITLSVLGGGGLKFGEGSRGRLGPLVGPGQSPGGGFWGAKRPRRKTIFCV